MEEYPYRTIVEGEWGPSAPKAIKNKLQIYFQSKKKSSGGDCQVEYNHKSSGRATLCFKSEDVLERVLAQEKHEITVDDAKVKLRLLQCGGNPEEATHEAEVDDIKPASGVSEEGQSGSEAARTEEPAQARAVVLEDVPEKLSREVLGMMVENMCHVKEEDFSLEMIQDINTAILSFSYPSAAAQFLSKCNEPSRFQQYKMRVRVLEPARSVRVEHLPPQAVEELLELYFEKEKEGGGKVTAIKMFPEEQAAIITFQDPKVTETVQKRKHYICKTPVSVYPYHESLGTVLYGKDRPEWKMPEAFTESLQHAVWKFLIQKRQLVAINDQLRPHFCQVELDTANAKFSPLPALLKQKGLTANHIEGWKNNVFHVFCSIAAKYRCFECEVSSSVWKVAEKEVHQAVKEDAILIPDQANGVVAVAGFAKDLDRIQQVVERIVQQASSRIERERDGISEEILLSPGMYYILQQAGLQNTFAQQYPNLSVTYRTDIQKLVLSGLPAEVFAVKSWVLERRLDMKQRPIEVDPNLLGFLSVADSEEISQNLFTSRGISAVYKIESGEVVLVGGSEKALSEANRLLMEALISQNVAVEDPAVLTNPEWVKMKTQLTEAYNSSKHSTVSIKLVHQGCISVSGFQKPVREVSDTLSSFITKHSHVEEAVPMRTCAVLKFIQENKALDWRPHVDTETVNIRFDPRRSRVVFGGARFRVQGLKSLFTQMAASLCTDQLTIVKPGAKKYFMENEKTFFSPIMKEYKCVILLQEEDEQEEAEKGDWGAGGEEEDQCQVQMDNGVLVTVRKADISRCTAQAVSEVFAERRLQMLSLRRSSSKVEQRRMRNPPQASGWNSPSGRLGSSADHIRAKPSGRREDLETKHTKEGLKIVLSKGNIEDVSTKVIVNTISQDLDLSQGAVSKAILQAAGHELQSAIRQKAKRGRAEYGDVLHTPGFHLGSEVLHTVCPPWDNGTGQAQQTLVDMVHTCLRDAERLRAISMAFPAIGTGNMNFPKPLVAKVMLSEVQAFSHKRTPTHLREVVFMVHPSDTQTVECFVREFKCQTQGHRGPRGPHASQSQQAKFHTGQSEQDSDSITSFFEDSSRETRGEEEEFVMVGEDFSPTVFQLCGETTEAVAAARQVLKDLIVREQTEQTIRDPGIAHLSQEHREALHGLQKRLTVRIQLESRGEASFIHLEGLTRDVMAAETDARRMIREVELKENQQREAALVGSLVEWQYEDRGTFMPFDLLTNLSLEKAFANQQSRIKININNSEYEADLGGKKAVSRWERDITLKRIDLKMDPVVKLPNTWDSMGGLDLKEVVLSQTSQEYQDVEAEFRQTGLGNTIIKIVRIQNKTLWKGYQIKKESLDSRNGKINNQRRLFHGTHGPSVDQINENGFNRSYAGTHAAVYGNGTYFAVDPQYSAGSTYSKPDAQGHKHMYLALVLVGEFTRGSGGMVVPPQRDPAKSSDLYNSVVDNTTNPTMFIIFNDVQAYPEYHIVFQ